MGSYGGGFQQTVQVYVGNSLLGVLGVNAALAGADLEVGAMADWVCGANEADFHMTGVNWGRDLPEPNLIADLRNVQAGDPSPDGQGMLEICRGIEVGHIFQLRTKYAEALNATVLDAKGESCLMEMGCYGIGITRIVGAAIEQGHDARGILFPAAIAPWTVCVVPIGYRKNPHVQQATDTLYAQLQAAGIDVLEDQVKLFVTAPIISRQPGGGYSVPAPESDKTVPNPVIALCIDLTNKAADARRRNASISEAIALDGFIKDYGCADALKAAGKR